MRQMRESDTWLGRSLPWTHYETRTKEKKKYHHHHHHHKLYPHARPSSAKKMSISAEPSKALHANLEKQKTPIFKKMNP
jgi:hypothetical protein